MVISLSLVALSRQQRRLYAVPASPLLLAHLLPIQCIDQRGQLPKMLKLVVKL
jgi:hypothetical protein